MSFHHIGIVKPQLMPNAVIGQRTSLWPSIHECEACGHNAYGGMVTSCLNCEDNGRPIARMLPVAAPTDKTYDESATIQL